jgi:hypothetical protein
MRKKTTGTTGPTTPPGTTWANGLFGLFYAAGVQMRFDRATPYNSLFLLFERMLRSLWRCMSLFVRQLYLASVECANIFPKVAGI